MARTVKNLTVSVQSGTTTTLVATWDVGNGISGTVKDFSVYWRYSAGDGYSIKESTQTVESNNKRNVYEPKSNAVKARVYVKPNPKKSASWTGEYVDYLYKLDQAYPDTPSAPSVEIKDYKLTAILENISDTVRTKKMNFQICRRSGSSTTTSYSSWKSISKVSISAATAKISETIEAGYYYKVRCQGVNNYGTTGSWGDYSSEVGGLPSSVTNVKCEMTATTSIRVTWTKCNLADSYTVEYTTQKEYFDTSSNVESISVDSNTANITGLDSGYEYFCRVKAVNDSGETGWSDIVSVVVATKPSAPTTWSSTTTAMLGEDVTLYWVHNSEDSSKLTASQVEYIIDNGTAKTKDLEPEDKEWEDEDDKTQSWNITEANILPNNYGSTLLWRVRTKGIHPDWSDWSIQREINVYEAPTLGISFADYGENSDSDMPVLSMFPFTFTLSAGPESGNQNPLSYYISIVANESYETLDVTGSTVIVSEGQELFSKIINTTDTSLTYDLNVYEITLSSGYEYTINATVTMNSGLSADVSAQFEVSWDDEMLDPDARVEIDFNSLTAAITPICQDDDTDELVEDVTLSVYRLEVDGSLTEISTGIENDGISTTSDPHPALNYARYRIVAISTKTGAIGFSNLANIEVGEPSIVIQWDEEWSDFDIYFDDNEYKLPDYASWSGSMVKLPGNVDVSESHDKDVSLVEYIGRKNPVSYYGTQQGTSASWSTEIDRTDDQTIYSLRRLAVYEGDVYVREPSGTGYWAQISVSMNINHCETTIPVSFEITRVEGGV